MICIKFHTKIIVLKWKQYSEQFFLKKIHLSKEDKLFFCSLTKKKKREFIGVRYALKCIGIKNRILYNKKNKPFFEGNKKYVSFSHSYEKIAVAVSIYKIGIDIEKLRKDKKIIKIKKKFVRKDEFMFIHPNYEEDYLHIIWGVKESLFKLLGGTYYNFLINYKVSPFCLNKDYCIPCWIINKSYCRKFYAFYRKIEEHYLVYIIDYSI